MIIAEAAAMIVMVGTVMVAGVVKVARAREIEAG